MFPGLLFLPSSLLSSPYLRPLSAPRTCPSTDRYHGQPKADSKGTCKIAAELHLFICLVSVNAAQELAELVESPPEGIKVELVNEADLYDWKVYLNGPENSPFQVCSCSLPLLRPITIELTKIERHVPSQTQVPQRIPLQAPRGQLRNQDLPPERYK